MFGKVVCFTPCKHMVTVHCQKQADKRTWLCRAFPWFPCHAIKNCTSRAPEWPDKRRGNWSSGNYEKRRCSWMHLLIWSQTHHSGLVAEYIVAIDVTRVRFPADVASKSLPIKGQKWGDGSKSTKLNQRQKLNIQNSKFQNLPSCQ